MAYNTLTQFNKTKVNRNIKSVLPGPGTYEIDKQTTSSIKRFPAYTMGIKPKQTSLLINNDPNKPDPGSYQEVSMRKDGKYPGSKFVNTKAY